MANSGPFSWDKFLGARQWASIVTSTQSNLDISSLGNVHRVVIVPTTVTDVWRVALSVNSAANPTLSTDVNALSATGIIHKADQTGGNWIILESHSPITGVHIYSSSSSGSVTDRALVQCFGG